MIRAEQTVKRKVTGKGGWQIAAKLRELWCRNPWLSAHRIGVDHGYRIDGPEHLRRAAAETPPAQGCSGKSRNDQLAALNTWEDEGGSTAAPAKAVGQ